MSLSRFVKTDIYLAGSFHLALCLRLYAVVTTIKGRKRQSFAQQPVADPVLPPLFLTSTFAVDSDTNT